MENDFGTGLRAHLQRHETPAAMRGALLPQLAGTPVDALPPALPSIAGGSPAPSPSIDERIDALANAEAELSFRERRVGEREMSFNVSVQRVVYRLAQEMLEGGVPALPQDELAVARARRGGRAA